MTHYTNQHRSVWQMKFSSFAFFRPWDPQPGSRPLLWMSINGRGIWCLAAWRVWQNLVESLSIISYIKFLTMQDDLTEGPTTASWQRNMTDPIHPYKTYTDEKSTSGQSRNLSLYDYHAPVTFNEGLHQRQQWYRTTVSWWQPSYTFWKPSFINVQSKVLLLFYKQNPSTPAGLYRKQRSKTKPG